MMNKYLLLTIAFIFLEFLIYQISIWLINGSSDFSTILGFLILLIVCPSILFKYINLIFKLGKVVKNEEV